MQIESLEASVFYNVCIDRYRTSVLEKHCSSSSSSSSGDRWIMCVPQSRSLGRRITRRDVGTFERANLSLSSFRMFDDTFSFLSLSHFCFLCSFKESSALSRIVVRTQISLFLFVQNVDVDDTFFFCFSLIFSCILSRNRLLFRESTLLVL